MIKLNEKGKEKCKPYWPLKKKDDEDGLPISTTFGNFSVTQQASEPGASFIRRVLVVQNTTADGGTNTPRRVIQLQMTHWEDFNAPRKDDFHAFLQQYYDDLEKMNANSRVPVLVHCSAGVGRTGTFIAADILARYIRGHFENAKQDGKFEPLDAEGAPEGEPVYANLSPLGTAFLLKNRETLNKTSSVVDVFRTVLWLRSQRRLFVQQDTQYIFLYDFLSYYIRRFTGEEGRFLAF
uniref:TYR_PHOSPHATASE_2 domain-containing protein n=1 Tax=Mesocestoides corti TaxID=53468 RepID=A0A5K3FPI3_MESCO